MHVFSFFWLEAGNYSILRQLASIKTTISDNYFFEQKYAALAFGNIVVLTVDSVNIRATCASALPTRSRSSRGPLMSYKNI